MALDQSTPLSAKLQYQLSQGWLYFQQIISMLSAPQRIIILGGIILLLPAYWILRIGTYQTLSYSYGKDQLIPRPSFTTFEPIQSTNASLVETRDGGFLAYVTVSNSNSDLAVREGFLEFSAQDSGGATVHTDKISFYMLPGQRRKIVVPKFFPDQKPVTSKIAITDIRMQKRFEIPTVEVEVSNPSINAFSDGQTQVLSHIINKSPYTLGKVEVVYTFFDKSDKVISVLQRAEFTVRPEEKREFPLFVNDLPATGISRMESAVYSNPLAASNLTDK